MQLNDILKEFIFDCEVKNFSKRTLKSYRNNNALFHNYLRQEFKITNLEEIKTIHIKRYFKFLMKKGLTPTYANGVLKTIRAFFRYCLNEEYIEENPCLKVGWQKEGKVIINTFTDEEIVNMLGIYKFTTFLQARNKMIIAFLVDTGARNNETCTVLKEDIKDRVILLRGKGNKQRQVSISPLLKKYMIRYERIRDFYFKDKIVKVNNYFLSNTGKPLTIETIERVVSEAGKKAGVRDEIRCSPHTIRHWHAQEQLRNGLDVYSLSRLLGHENISITKRYLQSIKDEDNIDLAVKTSPLMNIRGGRR
ncbi:tyrosine-type recombinase/integrase [Clostridium sp. P21]|uniref:Tyrosine-type recombinase/integrase n=1 Tax=Clostridium muellerianum TaxID=2716538 RepID=A0A7Y0ECY6_9CLOT|nr:tyrosine-type recombinase/integrase [Clostridium muellerianum]NMM61194.1 tyrosine-type recombinase/integrase [Clostridium muellerianum]